MRARVRTAVFLGACLLAALAGAPRAVVRAEPTATAAAELAPNPALQESIRAVASTRDEEELSRALAALRRTSAPDFSDLVPQLAIFLLTARGEREGMTPAVIVSRLGISHADIERAVAPHLATAGPALRAQLENLRGHDD